MPHPETVAHSIATAHAAWSRALARLVGWRTLRAGAWLFVAGSFGSFLSYLYHFAMGRMLEPGDYAALVSLLALSNLVLAPFRVSRTIVSDFTTRMMVKGHIGQVKDLLVSFSRALAILAVIITGLIALTHRWWIEFLHLPSSWPLALWAVAIALGILVQAAIGVVQGKQDFWGLSLASLLGDAGRLVGGLVLVLLGLGLVGALGGFVVSQMILCTVAGLVLVFRLHSVTREPAGFNAFQMGHYAFQIAAGSLALMLLINSDTILARHFFSADQAGYYSAAATLGNAVFFLPAPVLVLLFPRAGEHHATGRPGTQTLRWAMLVAGLLSLGITTLFFTTPDLMVQLLYGGKYGATAHLIGPYGVAMTGYSLVAVLRTHYQARHDWHFIGLMLTCGVLQTAAMTLLPLGPIGYVIVMIATSWGLLVAAELLLGGLRGRDA